MSITFWRCLARTVPALGGAELFPGNPAWILVFAQTEKNRLAQFSVACPLGKLNLGNEHRISPNASFASLKV